MEEPTLAHGFAALAQSRGVPVSNHLWPEISAQLLSVTPTAHWLECADWWDPIIAEPLSIEDGLAYPNEAPGTGVSWNEAAVARHLVWSWSGGDGGNA